MRYLMKQRLFAWGEDFVVEDEDGNDAFFVDGRALSERDKLTFQDLEGNELAFISEHPFSLVPAYRIYRKGELYATIKKAWLARADQRFKIDLCAGGTLTAEGCFAEHAYTIRRRAETITTVSRQWFAGNDTYGVEIATGEHVVLMLAIAAAIDMCTQRTSAS